MFFNSLGRLPDAPVASPGGYAAARDGLRSFDAVSRAVRQRQDTLERGLSGALSRYPEPSFGSPPAGGLVLAGAAFASWLGTDAGSAAMGRFVDAAAALVGRLAGGGGAEQLPLPFEL